MPTIELPRVADFKSTDVPTIIISFATLAIIYYICNAVYNALFGPLSKFPGPPLRAWTKLPMINSMIQGHDNRDTPELHQQYGPVVRLAPNTLSFASGADGFQEIQGFKKAGQAKTQKDPMFYGKPINGVHSLITADDANHSRQRKILSNAFSDKALKEQEPLLKEWTEKMKDKLTQGAANGGRVDMLKYYNCTTFDIMGDLTFAEGLNMLDNGEYSPWVRTIFASIKRATFLRGVKNINWFTNYVMEQFVLKTKTVRAKQLEHWRYSTDRVDRRLAKTPERPDLWSRILDKSQGPDALTVGEHHSIASIFMIAGTETTATALSGITYYLLKNPDTLAKLSEEIRSAFSSFDDLHLEDLARQRYLMAVLQEGLRMYPPVPIALQRVVPKDGMVLHGNFVPEGTTVGVHHLATYRSEQHFKHADEFHPERWLGDPEFSNDHLDAMEPFHVGPRNCLGRNLAWHEMRLLLATVVLHFDMKLCEESEDWADQRVYTLWEKKPLICTLTPVQA